MHTSFKGGHTESVLTDSTCGPDCWEAKEDVCRCSCGGKNHGCLRHAGGQQPIREAKIEGFWYTLESAGTLTAWGVESQILSQLPPKHVDGAYTYHWKATDRGSPYRVKPASKQQLATWPELTAFRDEPPYAGPFYLVWKRNDSKATELERHGIK